MTSAIAELLESPTLPDTTRQLTERLEEERRLRERFYDEMRDDQKVEFINGEVILHSPAKDRHLVTRDRLSELLRNFARTSGDGIVRGEKALCVFPRNDYEPDICYFGSGVARLIDSDTMKYPVPDFIVEILSPSTEKRDRGIKFQDYEAHGVREYWIVDPEAETLEQYLVGEDGKYALNLKSGSGEVKSPVLDGFEIPIRAIFDEAENLRVLREILANP